MRNPVMVPNPVLLFIEPPVRRKLDRSLRTGHRKRSRVRSLHLAASPFGGWTVAYWMSVFLSVSGTDF